MNTKGMLAVLVVIVVLAAGGWYAYTYHGVGKSAQNDVLKTYDPAKVVPPGDFGDDGDEGGSVKPTAATAVSASIVGTWSLDGIDAQIVEFRKGGEYVVSSGDEVQTGATWKVDTVMGDLEEMVRITIDNPSAETTWTCMLGALTPEKLTLTCSAEGSASGETLTYTRVD